MKIVILHPDNPWTKWLLARMGGYMPLIHDGNYIMSRHHIDKGYKIVSIWEDPQDDSMIEVWQS